MNSKHTFAIIAYKISEHLESCIQSLLSQTVKSNIIICTSTPNDSIRAVSKKYNIELNINNNPGKANDWNYAFRSAKTKFVTLAHHDDIYYPKFVETLQQKLSSHPDSLIGFTNYAETFVLKNKKEILRTTTLNLFIKRLMIDFFFATKSSTSSVFLKKGLLSFGDPICCPAVMYNKSNLADFSFTDKLPINLDWEAWWRLANTKGSFVYVKDILLEHKIHQESHTTEAIRGNARKNEDLIMFKKIWPWFIASLISGVYDISYMGNKV